MCALFMCIGVFGGAIPYYASENFDCPPLPDYTPSGGEHYEYYTLYYNSKKNRYHLSFAPDKVVFVPSENNSAGVDDAFVFYYPKQTYEYYVGVHDEWSGFVHVTSGGYTYVKASEWELIACNYDVYYGSYSSKNGAIPNDDVYMYSNPFGDSSGVGGSVSANIGYLQDITSKIAYLTDNLGVSDMESARKYISFSSTTTSGLDLLSGNYSIRLYSQMCYYKGYTSEIFDDDYPLIYIDKFVVDDSLTIDYTMKACLDKVTKETESNVSWFDTLFRTAIRSDNVYLQICNEDTEEIGGYVKISFYNNGDYETSYITTVDKDLNVDENGYVNKEIYTEVGGGATYEDAVENSEPVGINALVGVDSFVDTLGMFTDSFDDVTTAISGFFQCVPSWILAVFGLSIAFGFVLFIIKILRG